MKELRVCEIRAANLAGDAGLTITGTPIVFNQETVIHDVEGSYREIILPGAIDEKALEDVHLFYNHDMNQVPLARTKSGTLKLEITSAGVNMSAILPNTGMGREVYEAVKLGNLSGASFCFSVSPGGDDYDVKENLRTIKRINRVLEVSAVPFPAYPQTSLEARSALHEAKQRSKAKENARYLIGAILGGN